MALAHGSYPGRQSTGEESGQRDENAKFGQKREFKVAHKPGAESNCNCKDISTIKEKPCTTTLRH